MVRLPDRSELGTRPPRAARGSPSYPTSNPVAEAQQQLGNTVAKISSDVLQQEAENRAAQNSHRGRIEFINFVANEDLALEEAKGKASPGASGFRDQWDMGFRARQRQQLASLPPELRPEFEARSASQRLHLLRNADNFERAEGTRNAKAQTDVGLNHIRTRIYENPDKFGEYMSEGEALVDSQPISPIEKDARLTKWQTEAARAIGDHVRDNVTDPDEARAMAGLPTTLEGRAKYAFKRLSAALVDQESGGDPSAVSPKGAIGLWQVMPETAADIAQETGDPNFPRSGLADVQRYLARPEVSERYGKFYLGKQLDAYGGDIEAALIAYNGGPGRADAFLASGRDWSVLPKETRDYVPSVLSRMGMVGAGLSGQQAWGGSEGARKVLLGVLTGDKPEQHVDGMNPVFASRLATLVELAPPEVRAGLGVLSGYRTPERQTELWRDALKKYGSPEEARRWVAPPPGVEGSKGSQHNHGTAADLAWNGGSFAEAPPAAVKWVHDNAPKLGLTFPLGNEPWHIEPVEARGEDGSLFPMDPRMVNLPLDVRLTIARSVERKNHDVMAREKSEVSSLVADDLASMEQTGNGMADLDPERVQTALGDEKLLDWAERRELAGAKFNAIHDMNGLTAEQIQERLASLSPEAGQPGFEAAQHVFEAAEKRATEIEKQRVGDPAQSVADQPEVVAAGSIKPADDTPEAQAVAKQQLVRARLSAQERVGIAPELRLPLTKAEASTLAAPIKAASRAGQEDWFSLVDQMAKAVGETYGELGDDVFRQVVTDLTGGDEDKGIYASRVLKAMVDQQAVPIPDARAVDEISEAGQIEQAADQLSDQPASGRAAPRDSLVPYRPDFSSPAFKGGAALYTDMFFNGQAASTILPMPRPSASALQYLKAHPETEGDFIKMHGADAVPPGTKNASNGAN